MGRRRIHPEKKKNPIDILTGNIKRGRPKQKEIELPRKKGRPKKSGDYTNVNLNLSNIILDEARVESEKFFNNNLSSYIAHLIKNDITRDVKQINVYKSGVELLREIFPDINEPKLEKIVKIIGSQNRKDILSTFRDCFLTQKDIHFSIDDLESPDFKEIIIKLPKYAYDVLRFKMKNYKETASDYITRVLTKPSVNYRSYLPSSEKFKMTSMKMAQETNNMLVQLCNDRQMTMNGLISKLIEIEYERSYPPKIEEKGEE